ncbi:uncharacterized protein LOC107801223 [Nicotiana tabacum]|uniref:Uncharacterized protein LOC107801223 n=1 Tax=Nicotiana tabacum TaxID=4097 RepID=A0A1S4AU20_TOBAC|nr:PREDICTED: uncharacterized protein LOC107801223 [Nicotiana tabacum]
MAQVLSLRVPTPTPTLHHRTLSLTRPSLLTLHTIPSSSSEDSFSSLQHKLYCNGRFSCLFAGNRKQEEARRALESALGGKKSEYEKWDKEIKRREEAGGGDNSGGGGWWGRWFGGSGDGHFWQEAQQASLAILGIIVMYLIVTKGDVILAVVFNPLLFTLRGARNGFTYVSSQIMRKVYPASQDSFGTVSQEEVSSHVSAKDSVARKWGSD